jgi:lysophospholipase L1-like esterase
MRKMKVSAIPGYVLLFFLYLSLPPAMAQNTAASLAAAPAAALDLKDGDRVVFLGNSLFENELQHGYLEFALTTRWPNRNVTYRNIGWNGDTVWGEARSFITNPPSAYELLIQQLTNAQPTVVFIAYGAIESLAGEAGLPRFDQGLNQLLDKIVQLGAKAILLSPIPMLAAATEEELLARNTMRARYATAIAKTATARGVRYIDIFTPLQERNKSVSLSDNGVHLNETGYYYLAAALEEQLGLSPRHAPASINVSRNGATAIAPAALVEPGASKETVKFTLPEAYLPLPLPGGEGKKPDSARLLKITGLKKGFYTLTSGEYQVVTASAKEWQEGVTIAAGAAFIQAANLQEKIVKKNEVFFHQYRPQNRTYILGFRSYEQGRHAQGLEDLNFIITWLEGQIALNRTPKPNVYQLTPTK